MRTHVDLFSGIGGFALACRWAGVETIAFAEIDPYASRVLQRHWPNVRNYGDVRNVPARSTNVWLVTGGVPCQPASVAGKRRGAADDRWLWPEALAAVERIRPTWICLENPTGIVSMEQPVVSLDLEGYGNLIEEAIRCEGDLWAAVTGEVEFIFRDLIASVQQLGYEVAPVVIPACGVGAWHRRYRVWIMGHAAPRVQPRIGEQSTGINIARLSGSEPVPDPNGRRAYAEPERVSKCEGTTNSRWHGSVRTFPDSQRSGRGQSVRLDAERESLSATERQEGPSWLRSGGEDVPDANGRRRESRRARTTVGSVSVIDSERQRNADWRLGNQWAAEPDVGRVVDGVPARLDRLRGLGNAIVPQVAYQLIKRMIEAEEIQS